MTDLKSIKLNTKTVIMKAESVGCHNYKNQNTQNHLKK